MDTDRPVFDPNARMTQASSSFMSPPTTEQTVESHILKYLKSLGERCVQFKFGVDGWPDRVVCYCGFFIGIEVKKPGEKATPRQSVRLAAIIDAGGIGVVADKVEDVEAIIRRIDDTIQRVRPSFIPSRMNRRTGGVRASPSLVRARPRVTPARLLPLDNQPLLGGLFDE